MLDLTKQEKYQKIGEEIYNLADYFARSRSMAYIINSSASYNNSLKEVSVQYAISVQIVKIYEVKI
jgi:hypothetical protein